MNKIIFVNKGIASKDEQEHLESIIFKSGLGIFLSQLIIQGPPIVFNYLIDPRSLSEYLIYIRLIQVVCQLSNVFIYQSFPQINTLQQKKEYVLQLALIKSNLLKTILSFYLFAFLILISGPYIFSYLLDDYQLNNSLFLLIIVMFSFERLIAIINQLESVKKYINWILTYSTVLIGFALSFNLLFNLIAEKVLLNIIISSILSYSLTLFFLKIPKIVNLYKGILHLLIISPAISLFIILLIII